MNSNVIRQNKLFRLKEIERNNNGLARRIKHAKSAIDDTRPKTMSLGRTNFRRLRIIEDNNDIIHRNNGILLSRISKIAKRQNEGR